MKASQLLPHLVWSLQHNFPVLIKGKPAIGKTDLINQSADTLGYDLLTMIASISDPTDFKGQPFALNDTQATFLPYSDLHRMLTATKPLIVFIDDIGQATSAVQAALMQLLLLREVNGVRISDHVRFIAATNSKEDKAGVSGLLEPVKSRFSSIIEMEVDADDWIQWAISSKGNMPTELIAFVRYRPNLLSDFKPTKDIINSPSPRTVAFVGKMMNKGLSIAQPVFFEVVKGSCGEAWAAEFTAFLRIFDDLPNIDQIFLSPDKVAIPSEPAVLYALSSVLAERMTDTNAANAFRYIDRLPPEIGVATVKDAITRKVSITNSRAYIEWATKAGNLLFN